MFYIMTTDGAINSILTTAQPWKGGRGQQVASFLFFLLLMSNESKDNLYILLPISTISTIPQIPKFRNIQISKYPNIQISKISKYPNIQISTQAMVLTCVRPCLVSIIQEILNNWPNNYITFSNIIFYKGF